MKAENALGKFMRLNGINNTLEELFKVTFFDRFVTNGLGESGLEQQHTADNCFERIPRAI